MVTTSVRDPDPDPEDPHVFGPPGSFYQQAKIVSKTLIPTVLLLLFDFLSLKNDVNVKIISIVISLIIWYEGSRKLGNLVHVLGRHTVQFIYTIKYCRSLL
jgi:hypothetical protein